MKTIIQVPVDKKLRDEAVETAGEMGFSSLQDMMRTFLRHAVDKKIDIRFVEPAVKLSPRAARRYDKMVDEVLSGKVKTKSFTNTKDLMEYLNS